jgi:hypothetical protein
MIKSENEEVIKITTQTYKNYIGNYFGGCYFLVVTNLSMIIFTFFGLGADYVIGDWTSMEPKKQKE